MSIPPEGLPNSRNALVIKGTVCWHAMLEKNILHTRTGLLHVKQQDNKLLEENIRQIL